MFKSLAVSTLILGSALALVQPQVAAARDRDDYRDGYYAYGYRDDDRGRREWRERERHRREEWRERERWERRHRGYDRNYQRGYYDRYGYWHWC